MGKRAEQVDNSWMLREDDTGQKASPLPDKHRHSLFQRIDLQRAAYFADIEEIQTSDKSQSEIAGQEKKKPAIENKSQQECQENISGQSQLPSGFADLSTWCCDVFPPARPHPGVAEGPQTLPPAVIEQPTIILPRLTLPFLHIADMETIPVLPAAETVVPTPEAAASLPAQRRTRRKLATCLKPYWLLLCRRWQRVKPERRPARLKGRELMLARLSERRRRAPAPLVLPTPPGGKRGPVTRPPVDRLFG